MIWSDLFFLSHAFIYCFCSHFGRLAFPKNGNDVANFVDTDPPSGQGVKKGCEWAGAVKKGKLSIGAGTVVETTCKRQKRKA